MNRGCLKIIRIEVAMSSGGFDSFDVLFGFVKTKTTSRDFSAFSDRFGRSLEMQFTKTQCTTQKI